MKLKGKINFHKSQQESLEDTCVMRLYVRLPSHMFRAHRFVCFHTAVPEYLCCVFLKQRTCVTAAAMVLFYVMSKGQIHAHMYVISVQDRYSTQNATSVIYFADHYNFILEHCQMLELSSLYKTKTKVFTLYYSWAWFHFASSKHDL